MGSTLRSILIPLACAAGMTLLFWLPLWRGGGLIGGDLYSYYFPQKTYYADALADGHIPLWNNRVGHGYSILGESQTGALYPPNLVLYRFLDVNAAYNAIHLGHYILAWLGMVLFARALGLRCGAAAFAALIYVYGWFPARSCLEWAIIGGAWLPITLWCAERFATTAQFRFLAGLTASLTLQMLAGHYHIAFMTQLVVAAYALFRSPPVTSRAAEFRHRTLPVWIAIGLAFGLAAVQILPTWELKQQSQRTGSGKNFDPGYGHIPPLYLSQAVAPWLWYSPDIDLDRAIGSLKPLAIASGTNRVEAHLYFGIIPALLIVARLALRRAVHFRSDRRWNVLAAIGLVALLYTSGWFIPIAKHLPGFGFFMGPGRYGIITTLSVAVLAAATLEDLLDKLRPVSRAVVWIAVLAFTGAELLYVGRVVGYAVMIDHPPILARNKSPVAEALRKATTDTSIPRLLAPGPNLATNTGAAATPVYLGLAPNIYFDRLAVPQADSETERQARIDWLRNAAVTHILSFEPLDARQWPVELVWSGFDPLLNPAWARFREPIYLYSLKGSLPRASLGEGAKGTVTISDYQPDRIILHVDSDDDSTIILRDLQDPGWTATVNGKPAEARTSEGAFREVLVPSGKSLVVWTYRPTSIRVGGAISLLSGLAIAAFAITWSRRSRSTEKSSATP